MKLTIESTKKIVKVDGIACRVWEGHTGAGIPVFCFISRVAVKLDADDSEFVRELEQQREPSPEVAALPLRMIL